jgi:hypothetical protein
MPNYKKAGPVSRHKKYAAGASTEHMKAEKPGMRKKLAALRKFKRG